MKRAGYPIQSADTLANGEKDYTTSFFRPDLYETRDGKTLRLSEFQGDGYPALHHSSDFTHCFRPNPLKYTGHGSFKAPFYLKKSNE